MLRTINNNHMRQFISAFILLFLLLCGCSNNDLSITVPLNQVDRSFPKTSRQFGQSVAKEIRGSLKNMYNAGICYSTINDDRVFKDRFFKDYFNQSFHVKKHQMDYSQIVPTSSQMVCNLETITELQFSYINKVAKICSHSHSYEDFSSEIVSLNREISEMVPFAQQQRLYNMIAAFYYGLSAIYSSVNSGYSIKSIRSVDNQYRILTRSETGSSGIWNNCSYLAAAWALALGEPSFLGEIVALAYTVYVAGALTYYYLVCSGDTSEVNQGAVNYEAIRQLCEDHFAHCQSPIPDGCSVCLQYCLLHEGAWPPQSTHQCYLAI